MNVFLFHRDLRIVDNTGLNHAPQPVTPMFVFVDEQINPQKNHYFSHAAVQFMCESLKDLDADIKGMGSSGLNIYHTHGSLITQLEEIHAHDKIASITQNKDFTVYALTRDAAIQAWCTAQTPPVQFNMYEDYDVATSTQLLLDKNGKQEPYTVLSAYYNRFLKESVVPKVATKKIKFARAPTQAIKSKINIDALQSFYIPNTQLAQHGGRRNALKRLKELKSSSSAIKNYDTNRNYPALNIQTPYKSTTMLSAHLKFGTLSIREMYWSIVDIWGKADNPLVRELVFRSFYKKMCTARPELERAISFRQSIDIHIPWIRRTSNEYDRLWKAWIAGRTGFPIVDAGMRQMNATGHMHGRVRMVAATILTRYFLIDWRDGARYFAQHLVDYDPCSNNMGWQFSAALGENAQNIYRAPMNPFLQAKKYDPDAVYIKHWIPELANVQPKQIHTGTWNADTYVLPIVSQKDASRKAVELWKHAVNI